MNTVMITHRILRAVALLATAACANAASIVWNPSQNITGNSDVSLAGDFAYAYNLGGRVSGNPVNTTVNGVVFSGAVTDGVAGKFSWSVSAGASGWSASVYSSTSAPFTGLSADYRMLLQSAIRANNAAGDVAGVGTLTLLGLTVGHQYQVQLWTNDSRGGQVAYDNSFSATSLGGGSVTLDSNTKNEGFGGLGQYVIGTFVATGTSQDITLTSLSLYINNHDGVILNAFQVRDLGMVPEPGTSALLFGACALAAVAVRRRR